MPERCVQGRGARLYELDPHLESHSVANSALAHRTFVRIPEFSFRTVAHNLLRN